MSICSYFNKNKKICISDEVLHKIYKFIFKESANNQNIDKNMLIKKIDEKLKQRYGSVFENDEVQKKWLEYCGLENYKNIFFKPQGPVSDKNNDEQSLWLSNFNTDDILRQTEKHYPKFKFFETTSIDFANYINPFDTFNFINFNNSGKKYIGMIINTAKREEAGEHWVAIFIDFENNTFEFYNSGGNYPPNEIEEFANKFCSKLEEKTGKEFKLIYNQFKHQKTSNTECGMFCLNFIINRLRNVKFSDYIRDRTINDENMKKLRNKMFTDREK